MLQVVTLTINPALDKSTEVDNVVANRKLRCKSLQWEAGGGGVNVARVIKRFGGSPLSVYPAGGPQGEMFRDLLDEEGIIMPRCLLLKLAERRSGIWWKWPSS